MDNLDYHLAFKSVAEDGSIEGIAAGYGNVDLGGDRIMPGAATKALQVRQTLPMLFAHDLAKPIGVWSDLKETPDGLSVKGRIVTATQAGAEAHALARAGALTGISIGYKAAKHNMVGNVRELHEIDLHEASLVPVPMNDRARVTAVKSVESLRELEDLLRSTGLARGAASKIAAAGWPALAASEDLTPDFSPLIARIQAATASLNPRF